MKTISFHYSRVTFSYFQIIVSLNSMCLFKTLTIRGQMSNYVDRVSFWWFVTLFLVSFLCFLMNRVLGSSIGS
jgi:hypothetical protein